MALHERARAAESRGAEARGSRVLDGPSASRKGIWSLEFIQVDAGLRSEQVA
jgi:hypothetical protein